MSAECPKSHHEGSEVTLNILTCVQFFCLWQLASVVMLSPVFVSSCSITVCIQFAHVNKTVFPSSVCFHGVEHAHR